MAQQKIVSVTDGPRISVNTLIKNPTVVPKRILELSKHEFIIDSLLRRLPPNDSGAVVYEESTPLFADGEAAIVNEFGEIPVISGKVGQRKVVTTIKRGLALLVSEEMRRRNNMDRVNTQMKQIKNTMVRTWDTVFFQTLLNHPDVGSIPATLAWDNASSKIRTDLSEAMNTIDTASLEDAPENFFGFEADTLVIGHTTRTDLISSDDFAKAYTDKLVDQAPAYTGTLPGTFFGLNIMVSREMDRLAPGKALVLQRGVVGGISDERALSATPLYELRQNESWRSDVVRQSAIAIDQPLAACWITGV